MNFIGETAALVTVVCWAVTGIFFTIEGRRVGSWIVNLTRLTLALIILFIIHRVWIGTWLPQNAGTLRWSWFALSGVIGLTLGDALLFSAHIHIGPRLTSLLLSSVPIITVVVAWIFLEERLAFTYVLAVLITTGGIAWVVLERNRNGNSTKPARSKTRHLIRAGRRRWTGTWIDYVTHWLGWGILSDLRHTYSHAGRNGWLLAACVGHGPSEASGTYLARGSACDWGDCGWNAGRFGIGSDSFSCRHSKRTCWDCINIDGAWPHCHDPVGLDCIPGAGECTVCGGDHSCTVWWCKHFSHITYCIIDCSASIMIVNMPCKGASEWKIQSSRLSYQIRMSGSCVAFQ